MHNKKCIRTKVNDSRNFLLQYRLSDMVNAKITSSSRKTKLICIQRPKSYEKRLFFLVLGKKNHFLFKYNRKESFLFFLIE